MRVTPQEDGSLWIDALDQATRFDMGNEVLFAVFNGHGDLAHLLHTDGFSAGRWEFALEVDRIPVHFDRGRAIGRLWQLHGQAGEVKLHLESFLDQESATVFQRLQLENSSAKSVRAGLTLRLSFNQPARLRERLVSAGARNLPRLPGLQHLWGQGWAKKVLPGAAKRLTRSRGCGLEIHGRQTWVWGASQAPDRLATAGLQAKAQFSLDVPSGGARQLAWVLAAGDERQLESSLARHEAVYQQVCTYARWLRDCHPVTDALPAEQFGMNPSLSAAAQSLLQSLFVAGLNSAVAMFKRFPGDFAGLLAGAAYAYPPRLYYRDSYWTAQVLLKFRPDLVRRHLLSLARGIHPSGACPSAVFAPHLFQTGDRPGALDWLPDHYDAPPYFVLLLDEYLRSSGDQQLLHQIIQGTSWTVWQAACQALLYLTTRDRDGDGLIEKPYQANDWADNVRRNVWVTYDQVLYAAALQAGARLAAAHAEVETAERFQAQADKAREALIDGLWDEELGYLINYRRPGFSETHFSIDTLLAVYYNLVDERRARRILQAARLLQTRYNPHQPFGDWGVMCVYPLYRQQADLFDITAQPYRYHNGADWPYWDGVYAAVLQRRNDPDWRYVLARWWEYSLEHGWITPVEYYSPPYPGGGMLQGWSGMPAAVLAGCLAP
jgi:hypothetical protein